MPQNIRPSIGSGNRRLAARPEQDTAEVGRASAAEPTRSGASTSSGRAARGSASQATSRPAGASSRRIGNTSALAQALQIFNAISRSSSRRQLSLKTMSDQEWEDLSRQDATLIRAVLDAAASADPAERNSLLDAEDHARLHVGLANACLRRPVTRQHAGQALSHYRGLAVDPGLDGTRRLGAFQTYAEASLAFAGQCADAARQLVAARRLVPDTVPGEDALSLALASARGQPVPASAHPLAHALFACFELQEWVGGELNGLQLDGLADLAAEAHGLLPRLTDLRDLYLATGMTEHLENFHAAAFHRVLAPSINDLREAALDVMALAIQSPLASPPAAPDPGRAAASTFIAHLLEASKVFVDMLDLAPQTVSQAAALPRGAALRASVVSERGDHVPVQIESRESARSLADRDLAFRRGTDGQWHAVDTALDRALEEDPLEEVLAPWSLDDLAAPTPAGQARLERRAQRLLDLNFHGEIQACLSQAETTFPPTLANRYQVLESRWSGRAAAMEQVVEQLDQLAAEIGPLGEQGTLLGSLMGQRAAQIRSHFEALPATQARTEFIKCHLRPQAALWADLIEAGEATVGAPRALVSTVPGSLYEIRVEPHRGEGLLTDRYQPAVFVHLHLKTPCAPDVLARLEMADLLAGHVKSSQQRALGAQWQLQQREAGQVDARVHRSPIDARLLDLVLGREVG